MEITLTMTDLHVTPRPSPWRVFAWSMAACLWLAPLLAMRFSDEVNWTGLDFAVFGAMLLSAGGLLELAVRVTDDRTYRAAIAIAVVNAFLLLWINGAVGIIGSEDNPANLLFIAVPAVALIGALSSRGLPGGMVMTMIAAAAVQALVPLAAAVVTPDASAFSPSVVVSTGFFCGLWLLSAALFRASGTRDD